MQPGVDDYCLYELLGVGPDTTPEQLRIQYRRLMQKVHPDMGGSAEAAARLNRAFQLLSNPAARADYDRRLNILRCIARGLDFAESSSDRAHAHPQCSENTPHTCPLCGFSHAGMPLLEESRCTRCSSPLAPPLVKTQFADGRRAAYRSPRSLEVRFMGQENLEQVHTATTQDLSLNGVLLVSEHALRKGQRIRIVSNVFDAVAEVARSQHRRIMWRTEFLAGLRFHTLHMLRATGGFVSETV